MYFYSIKTKACIYVFDQLKMLADFSLLSTFFSIRNNFVKHANRPKPGHCLKNETKWEIEHLYANYLLGSRNLFFNCDFVDSVLANGCKRILMLCCYTAIMVKNWFGIVKIIVLTVSKIGALSIYSKTIK